jgi:hypothetical protein
MLKVDEFRPGYLGKLEFYLEALDRDVRKSKENPSIGVLLCASKNSEVVEYALSRAVSPTLIAKYQTRLPDRNTLQRKLHEFYELARPGRLAQRSRRPRTLLGRPTRKFGPADPR